MTTSIPMLFFPIVVLLPQRYSSAISSEHNFLIHIPVPFPDIQVLFPELWPYLKNKDTLNSIFILLWNMIFQPIVAHLLYVGKVRCFIISGSLTYKVTTTHGDSQESSFEVTSHEFIQNHIPYILSLILRALV